MSRQTTEMTCAEIHIQHRRELERIHVEYVELINAAAEKEFPDGTAVTWKVAGMKHPIAGKVTGRVEGETAAVMVKSSGGHAAIVRAWELTKMKSESDSALEGRHEP